MDKKVLVNYIKPVLKKLQEDGLQLTRVEIWPAEWNGHYTVAVSANWQGLSHWDRLMRIVHKLREMLPVDVNKHILNVYTYDTPESIDEYINLYVTGSDLYHVQSLYPPAGALVA